MKILKNMFLLFTSIIIVSGCCSPLTRDAQLTRNEQSTLDEILGILDTTITETEESISKKPDPTSPMKTFAEKLHEHKEYVQKIKDGKAPYDKAKLKQFKEEALGIRTNVRNPVERIMVADISYQLGQYKIEHLSERGKLILNEFTKEIMNPLLDEQEKLFPGRELVITIKTIGYADETPLGQLLAMDLVKDKSIKIPNDPVEKRRFLNRELSLYRANSIADYVIQQLKSSIGISKAVIGIPKIFGLGEEFPYPVHTVSPPYKAMDERRRICKIHATVLIKHN